MEEAVAVGDLVRLMTLRQGQANLVEVTLPGHTPLAGTPVRRLKLPVASALVTMPRDWVRERSTPMSGPST